MPGDSDGSKVPNWITCAWPPDFLKALDWQWEKKVIPYWTRAGKFAKDHGVRVALESHPGFVVYNVETALKSAQRRGQADWRQLRSEPPVLAGRGRAGGDSCAW